MKKRLLKKKLKKTWLWRCSNKIPRHLNLKAAYRFQNYFYWTLVNSVDLYMQLSILYGEGNFDWDIIFNSCVPSHRRISFPYHTFSDYESLKLQILEDIKIDQLKTKGIKNYGTKSTQIKAIAKND